MSELLRQALTEARSRNSVALASGVQKAPVLRFMGGCQSLRVPLAGKLGRYFKIECHREYRPSRGRC